MARPRKDQEGPTADEHRAKTPMPQATANAVKP